MPNKVSIKQTIIDWDNKYPVDLWFRKKYNIPFGSEQHRNSSLIHMCMEFVEFVELQRSRIVETTEEEEFFNEDVSETGKSTEIVKMTKKDIDDEFDDIDLDDFN